MHEQREQLIADLAADLTPVPRAGRTLFPATLWLLAAGTFAGAAILARGPLRAGALLQFLASPQFAVETLLGLAAIVVLAVGGLRLALPAMQRPSARAALPLALLGAWLALSAWGLVVPALEPSMAGKRAGCWIETALVGVPGLLLALWLARRQWPLHGAWCGLLLGCAAGAIPALVMQYACMYVPLHGIQHHLAPGLAVGALGALLGAWLLPRR